MLPFWGLAHIINIISGQELDGYSTNYILLTNIGAIIYVLLGCFFILKILERFRIRKNYQVMILWAIVFSTNLFYYAVEEFAMSHAYSFAFVCMFIYYTLGFFKEKKSYNLIPMGLVLGIITLIRPVNIIIILVIPFLAGNKEILVQGIKSAISRYYYLIIAVFCFAAIFSIQLIIKFKPVNFGYIHTGKRDLISYNQSFLKFCLATEKDYSCILQYYLFHY